jgi:hypothetical protein
MEIWAKESWQEFFKNTKDSFEKIAEKVFGNLEGGSNPPAA